MQSPRGFTAVEFLLVVLTAGIVAVALANPSKDGGRWMAYRVSAMADLRNLVTAQESRFAGSDTFYRGPIPDPSFDFQPSTGVSVSVTGIGDSGWAAVATVAAVPDLICGVYVGTKPVALLARDQEEGRPVCKRTR